jgi:hypothetical protein
MHSAIIVAEMPIDIDQHKWLAFLATIDQVQKNQTVSQLAANVWQVNFQSSPTSFARIVDGIRLHGLNGKILPFADEPRWIQVDSNPRTT